MIADEQWKTVQAEDQQNEELLELSSQILQLTKEVRAHVSSNASAQPGSSRADAAAAR